MWRAQDHPLREELSAILTDGLWTLHKKARAGLIQSGVCRACSAGVDEDVHHLWLSCEAWNRLRVISPDIQAQWATLPEYAVRCVICPMTASKVLKDNWRAIQEQCCRIWNARNVLGREQGWVGGDEGCRRRHVQQIPQHDAQMRDPEPPTSEPRDPRMPYMMIADEAVRQRAKLFIFSDDLQITECDPTVAV